MKKARKNKLEYRVILFFAGSEVNTAMDDEI
jgi:hypothetical protein